MHGQIVLITGTSGAGKTTTCSAFARRAAEPYLMFGMDLLVGTLFPARYTIFGANNREGYTPTRYGPMCMKALQAMHEMIGAAARVGQNMVVDHLMFLDPPVLQDCIWRMADVPVLFVCLKPSPAVLAQRLQERRVDVIPAPIKEAMSEAGSDIMKTMGEMLVSVGPWFYEHAYANDCYDLELDSSAMSADEICGSIEDRLRAGPGTAFGELRRRYPDPRA